MSNIRQDLVESATEFLKNPQIQTSPIEKKVEFLKSKGLNDEEINTALSSFNNPKTPTSSYAFNETQQIISSPPPIPERDWKDYFIMATTTVSLGYGIYYLFKKVLIPTAMPQSFNQLEQDKESINQEFSRIQTLLDALEENNSKLVDHDKENSEKLDVTVTKINNLIINVNETLSKNSDDLKLIKLELDKLKNNYSEQTRTVENLVDNKLNNINNELESLKKLLNSRLNDGNVDGGSSLNGKGNKGVPSASSVPSAADILKMAKSNNNSSVTINNEKEEKNEEIDRSSIPAWQLADN